MDEEFLKVAEISSYLNVSRMTVLRLVHSGELRAIRVGKAFRVYRSSYQAFLDKGGAGWAL